MHVLFSQLSMLVFVFAHVEYTCIHRVPVVYPGTTNNLIKTCSFTTATKNLCMTFVTFYHIVLQYKLDMQIHYSQIHLKLSTTIERIFSKLETTHHIIKYILIYIVNLYKHIL